jgi:hypothetical protein
MRLGVEANGDAGTGGRAGGRHAFYLHQSDALFKGAAVCAGRRPSDRVSTACQNT